MPQFKIQICDFWKTSYFNNLVEFSYYSWIVLRNKHYKQPNPTSESHSESDNDEQNSEDDSYLTVDSTKNWPNKKLALLPRQIRKDLLFEDWSKRIANEKVSSKLIHRLSKRYDITGGKWMIFVDSEEVDAAWEKVCRAIHEGKFPTSTTCKLSCF